MAKEIKIRRATEIEPMAKEIIEEYHEHLTGARILYLFTNQERKSQGRLVLGKTTKMTGAPRYLSGFVDGDPYDFMIVFDVNAWMEHADDPNWQVALVDHELTHIDQTEDGDWVLVGHDVEEFTEIVRRRGLWQDSLKELGYAVGDQLGLKGFGKEPVRS